MDSPTKIEFDPWKFDGNEVGARRYVATMPSAIESGIGVNDLLRIEAYLPAEGDGPFPTVLILHYWGATDHRVEVGTALELARKGMVGIVMSLPYHMERSPPGFRSGELAVSADPVRLKATMTQSILDIKRVVDWIATKPEFRHDRIGLAGSSLGAIVASLAVGVDKRITDAAFVVGGVDLAHVLWHSSRVVKQRDELRRAGYTESTLREALKEIEPLTYLGQHQVKNAFVIGAKHDTVIPGESTRKLAASLTNPVSFWLDTGHYGGFFVQKRIQNALGNFFSRAFADQPFEAPRDLNAPTVRLAITFDPRDRAQIGAGVDILRPNRVSDPFATLVVTPTGAKGIVGVTLDKGYSFGVFLRPKGITFGLMWSFVL